MAETHHEDPRRARILANNEAQRGIPGSPKRLGRGQEPQYAHKGAPVSLAKQREH